MEFVRKMLGFLPRHELEKIEKSQTKKCEAEPNKERHTDSMDEQDDQRIDFLQRLPPEAVDNILEHLDDRSLLNSRQVCKNWNESITTRNKLWKQRCARYSHLLFDLSDVVPFMDDTFRQFIRYQKVYQRLQTQEENLQSELHQDTQDCFAGAQTSEDSTEPLPPGVDRDVIYDDASGDMVVIDMKTGHELWRKPNIRQYCYSFWNIVIVDNLGVFREFDFDGSVRHEINAYGLLLVETVQVVGPDPTGRFILVEVGSNATFYLVDVTLSRITKLLTFAERETINEEEGEDLDNTVCGFLQFTMNDCAVIAAYMVRKQTIVVLVIETATGNFLMKASKTFLKDSFFLKPRRRYVNPLDNTFTVVCDDMISKLAIVCDQFGITFKLVWQKKLPKRFLGSDTSILMSGNEFLLGRIHRDIAIYRLHAKREECVTTVPDFFDSGSSNFLWENISDDSLRNMTLFVEDKKKEVVWKKLKETFIFLTNTGWLDGLCPDTTTEPGLPILMVLMGAQFKCLRWSQLLWTNLDSLTL